jgi:hypothetical protein
MGNDAEISDQPDKELTGGKRKAGWTDYDRF